MSRLRLASTPYRVRFKRSLVTSRMTHEWRQGWFVSVTDPEGHVGYGEVAPLPCFGTETLVKAAEQLEGWVERGLEVPSDLDPSELLPRLGLGVDETPALCAGIELAILDYGARLAGRPLASLFASHPAASVPIQRLLGCQAADALAEEADQAVQIGFETLKIKVGAHPLAEDTARLRSVRDRVGYGVRLRLDANGAWDLEAAIAAIQALAPFDIDLLEQPVATSDPEAFRRLKHRGIPIAADEALVDAEAARTLIRAEALDALVLKPTVLGGLCAAHALAKEACERGMRAIVTSALDRALGVCAALHLAAALPVETCGLGTLELLAAEVPEELNPEAGRLTLPRGSGLGLLALRVNEEPTRC